ncbi:hypothetical protein [Flavivirga aquatica]|nr:hypothetical protein [Flavivirga aquatica]
MIKIKNDTPKLSTDSNENILGGKKGSTHENSSKIATIAFIK